jgi:tRNA(Ile)-lysidine synthase
VRLVRPFLDVPKSDLLAYAKEQGIPFREDASNGSVEFLRNRVRLELLPLLKQNYQPGLNQVIARVSEIASRNSEFVTEAAEAWLAADESRLAFDRLHVAVQCRSLLLQLIQLGLEPDFDLIERLRRSAGRISVGTDRWVRRDSNGRVLLETAATDRSAGTANLQIDLRKVRAATFSDLVLSWEIKSCKARLLPSPNPGREIFDADRVGRQIILRHWQPGDRFQPIGMAAAVKLQDLFTNARIPRGERSHLVVACTVQGELFWVERLRISDGFKVTEQTIRRLLWRWKPR